MTDDRETMIDYYIQMKAKAKQSGDRQLYKFAVSMLNSFKEGARSS